MLMPGGGCVKIADLAGEIGFAPAGDAMPDQRQRADAQQHCAEVGGWE